jgi:tripartite-type tricarboxylate transporter receptor subunit TctC
MLKHAADIKIQHVPYKGAVPAITDLMGGRIQVFIGGVNSLLPHVRDGKLRMLAGAGGKRFVAFPELPAIAETVQGVALDVWLGVFMPSGVPRDIVVKANADIARVLQSPEIKSNLAAQGIEAATSTPENLSAMIRDDYTRWGKVIREAEIKAD